MCIQVRNKQFYSKGKLTVSRSFHSSRQRRVKVLYTGVWGVNPKQSTKKAQLVLKLCFIPQTHAAIPWYICFIIKIISPSLWYLWVKLKLQEDIVYLSCSFLNSDRWSQQCRYLCIPLYLPVYYLMHYMCTYVHTHTTGHDFISSARLPTDWPLDCGLLRTGALCLYPVLRSVLPSKIQLVFTE